MLDSNGGMLVYDYKEWMFGKMNAEFAFHSVGQGLFYTGSIFDGKNTYNFVYDCGGEIRYINHAVKSFFGGIVDKGVDLIVLSHLHEDHINGVKKLLGLIEKSGNTKRTRIVMPYSNTVMNLLYEYEYTIKFGHNDSISEFYNDPIRAIKELNKDCEIILMASDLKEAVRDAEEDGIVFRLVEHNYNDIRGVDEDVYMLEKYHSSKEYSNVYLARALSNFIPSVNWHFRLFQPNFNLANYEKFKNKCRENGIKNAMDLFYNKKVLSSIRDAGLGLNDSCIVMHHWFEPFIGPGSTVLTGDLPESGENFIRKGIALEQGLRPFVYQIPHHGAKQRVNPQIIDSEFSIVSYGCNNRYGHPDPNTIKEYMKRSNIISVNENKSFSYGIRSNSFCCLHDMGWELRQSLIRRRD